MTFKRQEGESTREHVDRLDQVDVSTLTEGAEHLLKRAQAIAGWRLVGELQAQRRVPEVERPVGARPRRFPRVKLGEAIKVVERLSAADLHFLIAWAQERLASQEARKDKGSES